MKPPRKVKTSTARQEIHSGQSCSYGPSTAQPQLLILRNPLLAVSRATLVYSQFISVRPDANMYFAVSYAEFLARENLLTSYRKNDDSVAVVNSIQWNTPQHESSKGFFIPSVET